MTTLGNFQSPSPLGQTLPSSPITQNKVCEVNVHIHNNESECHTSAMECNVLLKEQESLWGLTSVVQRSKAHVAISNDPVEFPLSSEFLEKFEHHLRKRLIQHHQGQPCRIHGSLSLMRPLSNCSGTLESKSSSGLTRISADKDQSSENPNLGLSQPGSFCERSSEMFQIEEKEGKEEGHSQENDPKVHLLSDSKTPSHQDVGGGSDMSLNSTDDLNFPLPATSLVDKKGHSPAHIKRAHPEEIQKFVTITLPVTNIISGGESQIHSLRANIQPPKLPARRAGTPQETKNNGVNSNDRAEIRQGANREKSEPASRPSMSREIVRAERLKALQPKTSGVLTTSKPGISQRINRETIVTTENPTPKLSVQDPNLFKTQIMAELKLKLDKKDSEAQGQSTDMSHDSDSSACKASLTPAQDVSSGDEEVPQLLYVHSEDSTVSTEKQQEPWLPRQALRSCQDQNFPPAVKNDIVCPPPEPTGPSSVELGAGDAQVRISQPGGQRFPSQEAALEDKLGSKSSHSLTQKGQATSLVGKEDSNFIARLKNFSERLQPNILQNMQEALQEMGFPLSLTRSRGPVQSRAAFTGTAHAMSDMGKFPEEKLGRRPAVVTTCPQEPLLPAAQSGKPVQKGAVQAQAEPVQRRHFLRRAPSYDVTNAVSGRQSAILAGQGSTNTRQTRNEDRPPQNAVASKGQQICQKPPQSVPLRGTLPHPSPSCRPQAAKGPPAVLTTAGGAAFRDQPPRFRHTMLLQNFQGQTFPTPK
uniref:SPATA31 domain-containing protein n=1 Tax=Myotis myotis TaxID=51298 RepID=A0A7J7UPV1_MYOMY|nr:hypothetical protein mMyoMyo1_008663 [Myotis myotis]